jgi:hypothetical protein
MTVIMMNTDLLQHFHAQPTPPQKAEAVRSFFCCPYPIIHCIFFSIVHRIQQSIRISSQS